MDWFSQRFAVILARAIAVLALVVAVPLGIAMAGMLALAAFLIFLIAKRFRLVTIELGPARRGLRESGAVFEGEYRRVDGRTG